MVNVLLVGNGGREHAIAEAIMRSDKDPKLFAFMKAKNPGIIKLCEDYQIGKFEDHEEIKNFVEVNNIELAVMGPEEPLSKGVVDLLREMGIPSFGPSRSLARLETSKSFTRMILNKYKIEGNPGFKVFESMEGISEFIDELPEVVLKPDGLTGGKGVMVQGDHFDTKEEALQMCKEILEEHPSVVIEEKLVGQEFSLQCITDGKTVIPTPPVQDHKRRFIDDKGPNTGGMGSYTDADHSLPFMTKQDVDDALEITKMVAKAIYEETGEYYKGVMYGGFIVTKNGVKLIEYNARFGDPEAMNTVPTMKSDFVDMCMAVADGTLDKINVEFYNKATVCKYVVPIGYGLPKDDPRNVGEPGKVEIGDTGEAKIFYAAVDEKEDGIYMTGSRAIGVVGVADTIEEAEKISEDAIAVISGNVDHRPDVGTKELIQRRIDHMKRIRG